MPSIASSQDFRELSLRMLEDGYLLILGDMNETLEEIVVECILHAQKARKKELTLIINSLGGYNTTFGSIKAKMIESKIQYTGIVLGKAASNAFNLLQQCQIRKGIVNSYFMFHWGKQTLASSEIAAVIAGQTWPLENLKSSVLLTARSISIRSGVSMKQLIDFALHERWFQSDEAFALHFLDEVIGDLPLPPGIQKDIEGAET